MSSEIVLIVFSNDTILSAVNVDQNELILRNNKGDTLSVYSINPADYAIFTSPDPKYAEMPGYSHYSNCFGNPVNLVDLNGERPTELESSLMAQTIYYDKDSKIYKRNIDLLVKNDWNVDDSIEKMGMKLNSGGLFDDGFESMVFSKTVDGVTEYAYVFKGTNSIADTKQDALQIAGLSSQYATAIKNAEKLVKDLNSEITFVGHSLGGGLAAAASMATGKSAICFNPAAVSSLTKLFKNLDSSNGDITNYITVSPTSKWGTCPVTKLQEMIGMKAPGKRIEIPIPTKNPLEAHGIAPIVDYFLENK